MTGRARAPEAGRRLLIALAIVVGLLVLLVVVKYWPPWVADVGGQFSEWLVSTSTRVWRHTGGRWVTLFGLGIVVIVGLIVMRRQRVVGITIIEVAIAAGALVALLQPDGW
jgi:hypothetical protein